LLRKTVLANGIRVVTEQMPHFRSVSTGFWINVGSRDEADQEKGITHFIEHMLFKGTSRRNALEIAKQLDAVGGYANAFTSKENVCLHAKVLDRQLPLVVDILTDILLHSTYDPVEIDRNARSFCRKSAWSKTLPTTTCTSCFSATCSPVIRWRSRSTANSRRSPRSSVGIFSPI